MLKKSKIAIISTVGVLFVSGILIRANAAEFIEPQEKMESEYEKIAMSDITGEGKDPQEISGVASAKAAHKEWYEYITYSSTPIGQVSFSSDNVIIFYDPYDYSSSLIMELDRSGDYSSANTLTETYSTSTTLSMETVKNTVTSTGVTRQNGVDTTYGYSGGFSSTEETSYKDTIDVVVSNTGKVSQVLTDKIGTEAGVSTEVGASLSEEIILGGELVGVTSKTKIEANDKVTVSEKISTEIEASITNEDIFSDSTETYSERAGNSSNSVYGSESQNWTVIADRLTVTTGCSTSVSNVISTTESATVTKTFNAAYFNESGSPLQWRVAKYKVKMPLYYQEFYYVNGEWINVESGYCLLTTIQGACRSWLEGDQAYYEHWGTGEKVLQTDFWNGFFSTEELISSYENRLYPD